MQVFLGKIRVGGKVCKERLFVAQHPHQTEDKMSAWLIIVTGLIYAYIGAEQTLKGNMAMAVVYSGYAFSNIGLYLMATK